MFDGVNDYASAGSHSSLRPSSAFTLACWYYTAESGAIYNGRLIDFPKTNGYPWEHLMLATGQSAFWNGSALTFISGTHVVGAWTHSCATYDGATLRIHTNGVLIHTVSVSGTVTYTTSDLVTIGNYAATNPTDPSNFAGLLTDPRIYGRALSLAEIQQICSGTEPDTTSRLGYWPLTESSGAFANSGSATSSSLSLANGAVRDASIPTFLTFGASIRRRTAQASIRSTF